MFDFGALKAAVEKLGETRASIRSEIETLQTERESIAGAPPTKAEIKAAIAAYVNREASEFNKRFKGKIEALAAKPGLVLDSDRSRALMRITGTMCKPDELLTDRALDCVMAFGMRGPLISSLQAAVDELDINEGLPMAERASRLAQIDRKIEALLGRERELVEAARSAGFAVE
jgi:hypothetical protein